nr:unnamed protein product [Digitaria exilis]
MLLASQSRRLSHPPPPPPTPVGTMDALPPELQTTILSRLPARDVVRTSILSRPWRRRWESVPDLDIDLTDLHSWATATTFLSRCAAPIRRLRLHGVPPHLAVCVDSWLRLAAGKSPRVLSVDLPAVGDPPPSVLTSLFACDGGALVELRLGS